MEGFIFLLASQILPTRFPSKLSDGSCGPEDRTPFYSRTSSPLQITSNIPRRGKFSASASRQTCIAKAGRFFAISFACLQILVTCKEQFKALEPPSCAPSHLSASPSIFLPVLLLCLPPAL